MSYVSLKSTLNTVKYKGKTVKQVADIDKQYLIWLHNSKFNVYLGKSVFEYLGLWNTYKNTEYCKRQECINK